MIPHRLVTIMPKDLGLMVYFFLTGVIKAINLSQLRHALYSVTVITQQQSKSCILTIKTSVMWHCLFGR